MVVNFIIMQGEDEMNSFMAEGTPPAVGEQVYYTDNRQMMGGKGEPMVSYRVTERVWEVRAYAGRTSYICHVSLEVVRVPEKEQQS